MAHEPHRHELCRRSDIDHHALATLAHWWNERRDQSKRAPVVDLQGPAGLIVVANAPLCAPDSAAGVADQDVNSAKPFDCFFGKARRFTALAKVGADDQRPLAFAS